MLGRSGGRLPERVREGTWLGHVAEHAAIEVQRLVGIPVSFGRTRETRTPGVYNLVYEMEEERVGVRAGKLALDVVEHCAGIYGEAMDLEQRLDGLKRLREKWALGPSTKSIVDTEPAEDPGHHRLHHRPPRGGDRGGQGPHQAPPGRPGGARPQGRSHGRGVLTNIRSERELRQAYQEARKHREEN